MVIHILYKSQFVEKGVIFETLCDIKHCPNAEVYGTIFHVCFGFVDDKFWSDQSKTNNCE